MSFALALAGALVTIASLLDPRLRSQLVYVPFAFYTCMELLQGWQYSHVNRCGSPANAISTEIAYLLVIVQPLMWNAIYYYRSSACACAYACERNLFTVGMVMGVVWIVFSVAARLLHGVGGRSDTTADAHSYVPEQHAGAYRPGAPFATSEEEASAEGAAGCTLQATPINHLHWRWASADFSGLDANWLMYLAVWFVPALISASQRRNALFAASAAAIAAAVTWRTGAVAAEFSSLWCLYSVPFLVAALADAGSSKGRGRKK